MSTLRLKFSEKAAATSRHYQWRHVPSLLLECPFVRRSVFDWPHLLDKMANAHQRGGDVSGWLPLLSQTQVAIEAVASERSEAAMRESLTP